MFSHTPTPTPTPCTRDLSTPQTCIAATSPCADSVATDAALSTTSSIAERPLSSTTSSFSYQPWKVFPASQWDDLKRKHGASNVKLIHVIRHAQGTHNVLEDYKNECHLDARLTEYGIHQCQQFAQSNEKLFSIKSEHDVCVVTSPMTRCIQTALLCFPTLFPKFSTTTLSTKALATTTTSRVPLVAIEAWRETINFACDHRRTIPQLQAEFPMVDFRFLYDAAISKNEKETRSENDTHCTSIQNRDNHASNDMEFDHAIQLEDPLWYALRRQYGPDWDSHMESADLHTLATKRCVQALQSLEERSESQIVVSTHSAFLRCLLNWGQTGGVPMQVPQHGKDKRDIMDGRQDIKLLDYADATVIGKEAQPESFERYMRQDFENCELRSFCLLVHDVDSE